MKLIWDGPYPRGTYPVFYEHNGSRWVQFFKENKTEIEIPDGSKLLNLNELTSGTSSNR